FRRAGLEDSFCDGWGLCLPRPPGCEGGVLTRGNVGRGSRPVETGQEACPTEDDRRYPKRPLVGVGAIILRRDRILMAQRGKEPLKGWWSLPGGALEIGESLK